MRRFSNKSMSSMNSGTVMAQPSTQGSTKSSARGYDTGFPEPFCGSGNTTRRHPEANIAPGACITGADIDVNRALQRSQRSFMTKSKNRHTLNYGKLDHSGPMADYTMSTVPSSTIDDANQLPRAHGNAINRPTSSAQSDRSAVSSSASHDDTTRNTTNSRRPSFLRKLRNRP